MIDNVVSGVHVAGCIVQYSTESILLLLLLLLLVVVVLVVFAVEVLACMDMILPSVRHRNTSPFCNVIVDCVGMVVVVVVVDGDDDNRGPSLAFTQCNDNTNNTNSISSNAIMDRMNGGTGVFDCD